MSTTASIMENVNPRSTVEQFDKEFQRYTTKHGGKSARAVAMARAELAKYRALLFQDKKLEEANVKKGRLSAEQKAAYEKKIEDIEKALDKFHVDVAGYNKTKAASLVLRERGADRAAERARALAADRELHLKVALLATRRLETRLRDADHALAKALRRRAAQMHFHRGVHRARHARERGVRDAVAHKVRPLAVRHVALEQLLVRVVRVHAATERVCELMELALLGENVLRRQWEHDRHER